MNDAQKMLFDFCEQEGFLATEIFGDAEVWTIGTDREIRRYSINVYGDIIDLQRGVVIAKSNTTHDKLEAFEKPTSWRIVNDQTSIKKRMDTTNALRRAAGQRW